MPEFFFANIKKSRESATFVAGEGSFKKATSRPERSALSKTNKRSYVY